MSPAADQPWYLAKTRLGKERVAMANLQHEGFEVYLPMRLIRSRRDTATSRPLFPGHLFFRVGLTGAGWRKVFSTVGVEAVYRSGDHPAVVRPAIVAEIRRREEDGLITIRDPKQEAIERTKALFGKGARIRVKQGPLDGVEAIFHEALDSSRVAILAKLLGRETRIVLELDDIKAAD